VNGKDGGEKGEEKGRKPDLFSLSDQREDGKNPKQTETRKGGSGGGKRKGGKRIALLSLFLSFYFSPAERKLRKRKGGEKKRGRSMCLLFFYPPLGRARAGGRKKSLKRGRGKGEQRTAIPIFLPILFWKEKKSKWIRRRKKTRERIGNK